MISTELDKTMTVGLWTLLSSVSLGHCMVFLHPGLFRKWEEKKKSA